MDWTTAAAASVLAQRRYATAVMLQTEVHASDDLGWQASDTGLRLRNRVQLGKRVAFDPGVRFDWPSKTAYGRAWGLGTSLDLRLYPKSFGSLHLVVIGGGELQGGKRLQALDALARTETLAGFFEAELRGGGAIEWTPSTQLALALEGTMAPVQAGRWWVEGEKVARPKGRSEVRVGIELAWWWK